MREVHLPERGTVHVACQPGWSPSTLPFRSPFPLLAYSSTWTHGIVGTPSGFRRRTASQPLPRENNENVEPPPALRNYWMSSGKSTVPDDFPLSKPTIRSPVSTRRPPPRSFPLCRLVHLRTSITFGLIRRDVQEIRVNIGTFEVQNLDSCYR